jgi:hypothetical protein
MHGNLTKKTKTTKKFNQFLLICEFNTVVNEGAVG